MNTAGAEASTIFSDLAWPDFYALLGVPFDAGQEQLRARLREAYLEATANSDHRNVERRLHYQMMGQRIVPQARRILLEERTRQAYDRQLMLHRNGDPAAAPYSRFVTQLAVFEAEEDARQLSDDAAKNASKAGAPFVSSGILSSVVPSPQAEQQAEIAGAASSTRPASSDTANAARDLFEQAHAVLQSEKKYAEISALPSFDSGNESRAVMPQVSSAEAPAQITPASTRPRQTLFDKSRATGHRPLEAPAEAPAEASSEAPSEAPVPNAASAALATMDKALDPRRSRRIRGESSTQSDATGSAQNTGEVPILQRVVPVALTSEDEPDDSLPDGPVEEGTASKEPVVALLSSRVVEKPEEEPRTEEEAQRARVLRVERGARPLNTEQVRATNGQDLGNGVRGIVSSGRERADTNTRAPRSRVSVSADESDNLNTRNKKRAHGQRVVSQPVLMGLTALASAAAMFLILHLRNEGGNAVAARTSLRVVYSSEFQPVMEQAQRDFASTAPGRAIALDLQPVDSRDAMHLALGVAPSNETSPKENVPAGNANATNANATNANATNANATIPDIWIPGETLWSDRFNQVAWKYQQQSIRVARSLAVSPLVLIARGDHASALKKRFPNHTIPSWDALRRAVASDAPNHFGLTDPQRSGSGALVRLFMAREWCERNHIAWNKAATSDARLWKWMAGFEDNVPGNAALTGDMVKELVMGNSDRFWWGVGYESDALGWMKRGKALEIFYLPRTALAQHPFCLLERKEMTTEVRRARSDFETFLRSRAMQSALLQNGFRPTEIGLNDIPNNPFARADFRAKGLRAGGFRIDERINYDVLNALNVQWKARY